MHSHYARFSFNRPKIVRTFMLDLAMAHQNFLDKIFLSFLKRKVEKSYNFAYFVAKHLHRALFVTSQDSQITNMDGTRWKIVL